MKILEHSVQAVKGLAQNRLILGARVNELLEIEFPKIEIAKAQVPDGSPYNTIRMSRSLKHDPYYLRLYLIPLYDAIVVPVIDTLRDNTLF